MNRAYDLKRGGKHAICFLEAKDGYCSADDVEYFRAAEAEDGREAVVVVEDVGAL